MVEGTSSFNMQRYFVDIINNEFVFSEQDIFHISKVMRMKPGDKIEIVNEHKVYVASITSIHPFLIQVIQENNFDSEIGYEVILFLPLLKSEKTELILQKATELGVNKIIFYHSKRSIIHLNQSDFEKKLNRYKMIAKEASEQSHRTYIPEIIGIIELKNIDQYKANINLFAYEAMAGSTSSLEDALKTKQSVSVILGPEGGYDISEVNMIKEKGFIPISLGKRILRVETAAIYALSVISYNLEK